jgi:hypothetical protein
MNVATERAPRINRNIVLGRVIEGRAKICELIKYRPRFHERLLVTGCPLRHICLITGRYICMVGR